MTEQALVVEEYSYDFPEMTKPPASNYGNTLIFDGYSPTSAGIILMVADIQVKNLVKAVYSRVPFRAPETISRLDVANTMYGYEVGGDTDSEVLAYIEKATKILRGEMKPNPLWNLAE